MLFIFIIRELSVNRKDLKALNLVGLNRENLMLDPLAVQHLDKTPQQPNIYLAVNAAHSHWKPLNPVTDHQNEPYG